MFGPLKIESPKRGSALQTGWEGFFPYYAGFPESFARAILSTADLQPDSIVLDPWNGSGTTTYVASSLRLPSIGLDLNPVMVVIAKARLLPPTEADSIQPLGAQILQEAARDLRKLDESDPLSLWFGDKAGAFIRALERAIRGHLLGAQTVSPDAVHLEHLSGLAATNYTALFAVCRELTRNYQSSNPTWLRRPRPDEHKVRVYVDSLGRRFTAILKEMSEALLSSAPKDNRDYVASDIRLADTTNTQLPAATASALLTSPPYCTRIDYTAATRIELAVLHPLLTETPETLGRRMTGSTRVPTVAIDPADEWGKTCRKFLKQLHAHPSKASAGYYYKTHLDYFDKISKSIRNCTNALKSGAGAVFVVQDSFYKDIHNDLPTMLAELGENHGLRLRRRQDFYFKRSMAGINPRARAYNRRPGAIEAVLCFQKP